MRIPAPPSKGAAKKFGILFAVFLLISPCRSFTADSLLTLSDCLNLAFEKNRNIKIARISVQQAEEKIGESRARRYPTATLNGMYTRVGKVTSFTIPMGSTERTFQFGTANRLNFDAKIQVALFTWGQISSSIEISKTGKLLSGRQEAQQKLNVTHQVLQAFYSVLLNREVIRLQEKNLERARELAAIAESRYNSGGVSGLEVLRTAVQVKNAEADLEESRGNLKKSRLFLANTLGLSGDRIAVEGSFDYQPVDFDIGEIIQKAAANRTDLKSLQLQQQMARSQISLAGSGSKPSLFLFSGYNVQNGFDPMDPGRFVDNWNVGVQVSFPLFDGFATAHKTRQARLELRKAELQEEEITDLITLQVRQAAATLFQAEGRIKARAENIKLAQESLETAEKQFRLGMLSSLDVLNAQQTLARNESIYNQAIFNHIMAKLELSRAMADYSWFGFALTEN